MNNRSSVEVPSAKFAGGENAPSWNANGARTRVSEVRVFYARGAFGARAAEFKQQSITEIAGDDAFDAEPRPSKVRAVAQVTSSIVLARVGSDRAATKVGLRRPRGGLVVVGVVQLHVRADCDRGASVGAGDRRTTCVHAHDRRFLRSQFRLCCLAFQFLDTLAVARDGGRCGRHGGLALQRVQFRALCLQLVLLRIELRLLALDELAQRVDLRFDGFAHCCGNRCSEGTKEDD
jgi:hypothetical protein